MSENPISISTLNDFIFCPASIYFHMLDADTEKLTYQESAQLNGTAAHKKSDSAAYSSKKSMLQGISVYSEKYNLCGKIDTFDSEKGILTERKKKIKTVYDGYVFQLYGEFFALSEAGYHIKEIRLYSMDDNRIYPIPLPGDNPLLLSSFERLIKDMDSFSPDFFHQSNPEKCLHCIYEPMCAFSNIHEDFQC